MSQVLTVPTHFNDIGQLSEGFLDRVEQDTLILYGPVAYEEGSEIEFAVLLADGTPALEGTGRVRAAVDGGADRVPETRYDVVVEALELGGRYEVVFERLVLARQAVSDAPPAEADGPLTDDVDANPVDEDSSVDDVELSTDEEPVVEEVELTDDEVFSLAPEEAEPETVPPEESAPDTVPPDAYGDEEDVEPATVIAAVDAEAMMAEGLSEPPESVSASVSEPAPESVPVSASVSEPAPGSMPASASEDETDYEVVTAAEAELETLYEAETVTGAVYETATETENAAETEAEYETEPESDWGEEPETSKGQVHQDSMYAFEHGIAAEPQVGMPVPIPSMAAPPEAPPAPPTLRLAEPPQGLTRPSFEQAEESLFNIDGEVSDVHTTGLFAYEDGLPIPSRPPMPDPNRPQRAAAVEAVGDYDVEDSEPPQVDDDDYEEVRLSDFAEAAEEG